MKPKDAFKEPGRSEEAVNLRYNNYVKRYNSTIKAIVRERKRFKRAPKYEIRPQTSSMPRFQNQLALSSKNMIEAAPSTFQMSPVGKFAKENRWYANYGFRFSFKYE